MYSLKNVVILGVDAGDSRKLIRPCPGPVEVLREPQPGREVNVYEEGVPKCDLVFPERDC